MFSRVTRPIVAALAFGFLTMPALASAEEGKRDNFPVAGEAFLQRVDKRIEKTETHIEKALDEKRVSPEKRKEVLVAVQDGSKKVRTAAERAASDGTVTKEEAMEVRQVGKDVKQALKTRFSDLIQYKKFPAGERKGNPRDKKIRPKPAKPAR